MGWLRSRGERDGRVSARRSGRQGGWEGGREARRTILSPLIQFMADHSTLGSVSLLLFLSSSAPPPSSTSSPSPSSSPSPPLPPLWRSSLRPAAIYSCTDVRARARTRARLHPCKYSGVRANM